VSKPSVQQPQTIFATPRLCSIRRAPEPRVKPRRSRPRLSGTVVAVSCNPATFARDARYLIAGGFRLQRVVPIYQFVWTPHLELAALFRR